jgi:branched-chain amino acid transport system substrate-binding protein
MRRKTVSLVSLALAAGVALAACGSSSSKAANSSGSSGGGSATSKDAIKVEGVFAITSKSGGYPGADLGAKARFTAVNKAGGINGRQIDWLGAKDDGEDGTRNLQLVRQAALNDKAFAVLTLGQGLLPASSDFLNRSKVPYFGWGFMPGFCAADKPYGFGFNGCIVPPGAKTVNTSTAGPLLEALKKKGITDPTVAIVSDDVGSNATGSKLIHAAFQKLGANVVYDKADVPATGNVNFAPYVQAVLTSNGGKAPDAVVFNGLFATEAGMSGGLLAAGYKGALMNYLAYVPGLLDAQPALAQAFAGSYVTTQIPPIESGGAAIDQMKKDFEAIGADTSKITLGAALTYWQADVFLNMLKSVGDNVTGENFNKVINGGWTYKSEYTPAPLGPVTYPEDHLKPAPCAALVQIDGTKFKAVSPMTCYENVDLSSIK